MLDEIGDSALRALDADEGQMRGMLQSARREGNQKLSVSLKLMEMIRDTQKLRLQLAGLLSAEGLQGFRSGAVGSSGSGVGSGVEGVGKVGEDSLEDGSYRLYRDEVEDGKGV